MFRRRESKSCANCRAVKRRCDKQFPHCGQCIRKGEKCPGYRDEWDLIFRDQTSHTIKRSKGENLNMVASKSNGSSPSTYSPSIGSNEMEDMYFFKSQQHFIRQKISALSNASKLSPVISGSSMMRNQIFSSFLSECFPSNSECASDINLTRFILSGLSLLPQKSSMLEMALSALSCIFLGKIRHNEPLFQHGLQLYNRGIRHMSNILGGKMYNDDMVYTSVVFQQIQTHYCPYTLGEWIAHVDGLCAIMTCYRRRMQTTPMIAAIFGKYQKMKVLLSGIGHLSKETIAWLNEPNEGGPWFGVIRLLTEMSRITSTIRTTDVSNLEANATLLEDCLALEKDHMEFYVEIEQGVSGEPPTYTRGELISAMPPTDDLFGPAYRFSSLEDAMLHLFYWLSLSSVYPLLHQCRARTVDASAELHGSSQSEKDETHRLVISYVSKAARCLPYCGQDSMRSFAYYHLLCAVQVSRVYAHARDWDRFMWAQHVFTFIELSGYEYAARYREIWWDYWFDSQKHNSCSILNYRQLAKKSNKIVYTVSEGDTSDVATR
ncbi:hypothetical protein PENSTE_c003G07823 [Penicillium steckii]|uniref:Zn(2)-C6 fungal-type domain-containing protein n=1 Tax=Penicillium steckii TaxID=303698 RepID=A0A1V6TQY2_9EURO|nr:hypothetical protein PENSTE_c003G07823 [Penicillium steckii]